MAFFCAYVEFQAAPAFSRGMKFSVGKDRANATLFEEKAEEYGYFEAY